MHTTSQDVLTAPPPTKEGDTKFEVFGLIREHNTGKQTMLKHASPFRSQVYRGRLCLLKKLLRLCKHVTITRKSSGSNPWVQQHNPHQADTRIPALVSIRCLHLLRIYWSPVKTWPLPGTAAMLTFAASGRATKESNTKQSSLNLWPNVHSINASWLELTGQDNKNTDLMKINNIN